MSNGRVFEATDIRLVASALLARRDAVTDRGDRVSIVTSILGTPHRLYIHSCLKKADLAAALGIRGRDIRASEFALEIFTDEERLFSTLPPMESVQDAQCLLRQAADPELNLHHR